MSSLHNKKPVFSNNPSLLTDAAHPVKLAALSRYFSMIHETFSGDSLLAAMESYTRTSGESIADNEHLFSFVSLSSAERTAIMRTMDASRRGAFELFLLVETLGTPYSTNANRKPYR